ncbi:hypothetical protein [Serratia phage SP1]|nr:hypothetical protein [Serratia phage SP1]
MKQFTEFMNESRLTTNVMTESAANLLKYSKGQKVTVTLDDGTSFDMDVEGYNYAVEGKLYNKSHAKFANFKAFTDSIEDVSVRKAVASGDSKVLMAHGHTRIDSKINKPGEDNFALIGYQSGKETYGYQRTGTIYNKNGKLVFANTKGKVMTVTSIK